MTPTEALPFLRVPPFPGHRAAALAAPGRTVVTEAVVDALVTARVGGSFWAAQPAFATADAVLLAPDNPAQLAVMLAELGDRAAVVLAPPAAAELQGMRDLQRRTQRRTQWLTQWLTGPCDPWWLARHAAEIWAGAGQEVALVGALCGTPLRMFGSGPFGGCDQDPTGVALRLLGERAWREPFNGGEGDLAGLVELLALWRQTIDGNRDLAAIFGVAGWKRVTMDPLLWDGSGPVRHRRRVPRDPAQRGRMLAWASRTSARMQADLVRCGAAVGEVEDGFIRSSGLGANCVPPLSIIADHSGIYFDASGPSDLETLLEEADIAPGMLARAAALRATLVREAVSKYAQGGAGIARPTDGRRRVLVTGQVEDDRSILTGGAGMSNLELLVRTRAMESDAWIIYKPHPDVEAGHRKGHVAPAEVMRHADEIARDAPILPLVDSVDALHVITSLAGFEALLRGKAVTTHGTPFYAGWGLTRDLAPVPPRRTRRRSLDELVAATLLLYPRYTDPVTRLPCPAEVVVQRIANGQGTVHTPLVTLRTWQGRINRGWRRLTGGVR